MLSTFFYYDFLYTLRLYKHKDSSSIRQKMVLNALKKDNEGLPQ